MLREQQIELILFTGMELVEPVKLTDEDAESILDEFLHYSETDHTNPTHYNSNSMEVWEMMLKIWGKEKFIAFCEMNAFKYRMRAGLKQDQPIKRDLDKAKWYEAKVKELI